MMSRWAVAGVKAAAMNGHSVGDIARRYQVSRSTVHAILTGQRHSDVPPATESEPITPSRRPATEIKGEGVILRARGVPVPDIARQLGVSVATVYRHTGPGGSAGLR